MGETTHDVCTVVGLVTMAGLLATHYPCFGPGHQLDTRLRIEPLTLLEIVIKTLNEILSTCQLA